MSFYTAEKARTLLDLARNADTPDARREADQVLVMDSHVLAETVIWLYERLDQLSTMWHQAGRDVPDEGARHAYASCAKMVDLILARGEDR